MNMLNSLIIEGEVTRGLEKEPDYEDFEIVTTRYYKKEEEWGEEKSYFTIEVHGEMLANVLRRNICKGRGVRIVGRIKQRRWKDEKGKEFSRVVVIAEHIEYKARVKRLPTD